MRFSGNAKDVEDGINKPVMSQVTQQIATEKSEKAVELRDNGDIAGARKVLEENAEYIKRSTRRRSPRVPRRRRRPRSARSTIWRSRAARPPTISKRRTGTGRARSMRSDQHKAKVQQAY